MDESFLVPVVFTGIFLFIWGALHNQQQGSTLAGFSSTSSFATIANSATTANYLSGTSTNLPGISSTGTLTGYTIGATSTISSSDTVFTSIQKNNYGTSNAAILAQLLNGLTATSSNAVVSSDTILAAFEKIIANISASSNPSGTIIAWDGN